MKQIQIVTLAIGITILTGCALPQPQQNQSTSRPEPAAGSSATAPQQQQGERIPVVIRAASGAKQATAELVLVVSWSFAGTEGGVTQPSEYSQVIGPSGITGTPSGPASLLFSTLYKKTGEPLRAYFKVSEGDLNLWWSSGANSVTSDSAWQVDLSPAWLAASKDLPATPEHPAGGISISSHSSNGEPLAFFIEFTEVRTLMPGPKIKVMGTE